VRRFAVRYLPRLRRRYRPELVLVFGSRARGDALADSDLDLLVVSDAFRGVPFLERLTELLGTLDPPFGIDALCYTPEEFAEKRQELGIVSQAVEEGLAL
jgi:predicted nucleotidyltransferase